ncbi:NAD-dependent epimerase/dehydratase family protein [Alienimonas chondri]|uniref:UDP-N-acetylglucosamine 4-epimerase n=1 Tax=Alienimonas chondri TaxID=2681879 RepID=A0ABX1VF84_9PLAN|nr:NAD-dependent epimerase/dehydratase family protein [Alienimonas chondri]NNJ26165.1 UDP-N-acetylglucosamine 4-epimerase [Alienimonas chondri]
MSDDSPRSAGRGLPFGRVLVTGAAGFIGAKVAELLRLAGVETIGADDLNPYYSPALKRARLDHLEGIEAPGDFIFHQADLSDRTAAERLFDSAGPVSCVIHLAAQAGVRHSLTHPHAYASANLDGFLNVLEGCRRQAEAAADDPENPDRPPPHLVYASSSSVYGANKDAILKASEPADHPLSLYAATKRANELMAHCYAHLYGLPCTGLRFFSVYGPWGRPDMAAWIFTERILKGEPIDVFGEGRMSRSFTYIDDVAEAVVRVAALPPAAPPAGFQPDRPDVGTGPVRIVNVGGSESVELTRMIAAVEAACGATAEKRFLPMQPGDVPDTAADTAPLEALVGLTPRTTVEDGIARFVAWFKEYHGMSD